MQPLSSWKCGLLGVGFVAGSSAKPISQIISQDTVLPVVYSRAETASLAGSYAPQLTDCPTDRPGIRSAASLSPEEASWLSMRRNKTIPPMRDLLSRFDIEGVDIASYIDKLGNDATLLPNIGLAFSGGGYRALLNGAGALAAFDSRTSGSDAAGHLGGLLQSSTYIAGLSGGSWLVGSIFMNDFTSVEAIMDNSDERSAIWHFDMPITMGPDADKGPMEYLGGLMEQITSKEEAHFETSLTDLWGRALSFQLISPVDGGPGDTFSSISKNKDFAAGSTPMPIFVADGRSPGQLIIDGNATVYEINPWELGTFDPTTFAFAPLEFVGSNFSNGALSSSDKCAKGFDNAGFIMGTSSSLFNQGLIQTKNSDGFMDKLLTKFLEDVGGESNDVANYPNPFYGVNPDSNQVHNERNLVLVDGGEDLQNLPLHPLTQPERAVDVIFAIDSSADTLEENGDKNWPNGTALIATYERSLLPIANGTSFPAVPDVDTFVNLGLNNRPVFFGCDAENTTSTTPLIVYIPNAPYTYQSNVSTFQMAYDAFERHAIIQNGYNVATMGNGTIDSQWSTCVGCAILHRSFNKTGTAVPDACTTCFRQYCWNGTLASSKATYSPKMKLDALKTEDETSDGGSKSARLLAVLGISVAAIALLM